MLKYIPKIRQIIRTLILFLIIIGEFNTFFVTFSKLENKTVITSQSKNIHFTTSQKANEIKNPIKGMVDGGESLYAEQIEIEIEGNESQIHNAFVSNDPTILMGVNLKQYTDRNLSFGLFCSGPTIPSFSSYNLLPYLNRQQKETQDITGFIYQAITDNNQNRSNLQQIEEYQSAFQLAATLEEILAIKIFWEGSIKDIDGICFPFRAEFNIQSDVQLNALKKIIVGLPSDGLFHILQENSAEILNETWLQSNSLTLNMIFCQNLDVIEKVTNLIQSQQTITTSILGNLQNIIITNPIYSGIKSLHNRIERFSLIPISNNTQGPLYPFSNIDFLDQISNLESMVDKTLNACSGIFFFDCIHSPLNRKKYSSANELTQINHVSVSNILGFNSSSLPHLEISQRSYTSTIGILSGLSILTEGIDITNLSLSELSPNRQKILNFEYIMLQKGWTNWFQNFEDNIFQIKFIQEENDAKLNLIPSYIDHEEIGTIRGNIFLLGLPVYSGLLFEINSELSFDYSILTQDPILNIQKTLQTLNQSSLQNWSSGSTIEFEINITNIGNQNLWGIPLTVLESNGFPNRPPETRMVRTLRSLGYDIEEMFDQQYPRYFSIDAFGNGHYNGYYPELMDLYVLAPYSQEFTDVVIANAESIMTETSYTLDYIHKFALLYNTTKSIYNPNNWILTPNQTISIFFRQDLTSIIAAEKDKEQSETSRNNLNLLKNSLIINNSTTISSETLWPSRVKYSLSGGNVIYETVSNSLSLVKEHRISSNISEEMRLIQIITPILNHIGFNFSSKYTFNLTVKNEGILSLNNLTILFPVIAQNVNSSSKLSLSSLPGQTDMRFSTEWTEKLSGNTEITFHFEGYSDVKAWLEYPIISWTWQFSLPTIPSKNAGYFFDDMQANQTKGECWGSNFMICHHTNNPNKSPIEAMHLNRIKITLSTFPSVYPTNSSEKNIVSVNYTISCSEESNWGLSNFNLSLFIPQETEEDWMKRMNLRIINISRNMENITINPGNGFSFNIFFEIINLSIPTIVPSIYMTSTQLFMLDMLDSGVDTFGFTRLTCNKFISSSQIFKEDIISIKIFITNEGTGCVWDIQFFEHLTFDYNAFELFSGGLAYQKKYLLPGEQIMITYQLRSINTGTFTFTPSKIEFLGVSSNEAKSSYENHNIEIQILPSRVTLFLWIPVGILGISIFICLLHRKIRKNKIEGLQ